MEIRTHQPRCMLVGLTDPFASEEAILSDFEELASLVVAYGGNVCAATYQNSTRGDRDTYIGKGKAQELITTITEEKIDIVVVNAAVKSRQLYALQTIFMQANPRVRVWDRVDLILGIFANHASTAEAKLQIKLASMRHMGPRIYGMGKVLSQQGGGIGTRGIGETNVELMQRHWRNEIGNVRKQIDKITKNRTRQMVHRKQGNMPTVSIVGYTNAGKTTLFNRLCGKENVVKDALFVTLDSSVGTVYLPERKQEIYVTDTIGFIQNLPTELIDAFKSTLMETIHADLLLHVIDVADPHVVKKIGVVEAILRDIQTDRKPIIYIFNKVDKASKVRVKELIDQYASFHPHCMSAITGEGRELVIRTIQKGLSGKI